MKPKHTPGPWISYDMGSGIRICPKSVEDDLLPSLSASQNSLAICRPPTPWSDEIWEEIKANAKLMAAAPDLIEALEASLPYTRGTPEWKMARLAIDKAKGQIK